MRKNFVVRYSVELVVGQVAYDIHNCFDYVGMCVVRWDRCAMILSPIPEHTHIRNFLLISFDSVNRLDISPRFEGEDLTVIEEIGYISKDEVDDRSLMTEAQASGDVDLFIRFAGNHYIRIRAQNARLVECRPDDLSDWCAALWLSPLNGVASTEHGPQ